MEWYQKKRGRPPGSKTLAVTPGKKRAREFLDAQFEKDLKPTIAAELIADKYGVGAFQIFKDVKRHYSSIVDDEWKKAEQARIDYEEMLASTIGPKMPRDARVLIDWVVLTTIRGQRIK